MKELKIDTGLGIMSGGLIGVAYLSRSGASSAMIINDCISCFFINGHWSLKRQLGRKKISAKLLTQISKQALRLEKFEIIEKENGIYNISEVLK